MPSNASRVVGNESRPRAASENSQLVLLPYARPWDVSDVSLCFMVVFGVSGNALFILLMSGKATRQRKLWLALTCISCADILFLVSKLAASMIKVYRLSVYDLCALIQHVVPEAALFVSVWLVTFVSLERAVAVTYPLRVSNVLTRRVCKRVIGYVIGCVLLLASSTLFCLKHSPAQKYYCIIRGTSEGACFAYYRHIYPWLKSILGFWLPSVLNLAFNVVIVYSLLKASHQRRLSAATSPVLAMRPRARQVHRPSASMRDAAERFMRYRIHSRRQSRDKYITVVLLTSSLSFLMLTLPYSLLELMRKCTSLDFWFLRSRAALRHVLFLVDLNQATNFIFYCLIAKHMRAHFSHIVYRTPRAPSVPTLRFKKTCRCKIQVPRLNDYLARHPRLKI